MRPRETRARPTDYRPTDPLRHTLTLRTPSERADRPTHLWLNAPEVARLALLELFAFGSGRRIQARFVLLHISLSATIIPPLLVLQI